MPDRQRPRTFSSPPTVKLVVVDDHHIVLEGLVSLFGQEEDLTVVGRCSSGEEAVRTIRERKPDVVILDLRLADMSALEVLERIDVKRSAIVLFTASATQDELLEAMRLGVRGVLLKEMSPHLIIQCVRKVAAGGEWIEQKSISNILQRLRRGAEAERKQMLQLTHREIEVVRLACRGLRNAEIGDELSLSVSTIKIHLHNIYGKLGIRSRAELMLWTHRGGC